MLCSAQAATLICTCVLSVVSASPQYNNNRKQFSAPSGQGSYSRSPEGSATILAYNNDQNFNGDYKYR